MLRIVMFSLHVILVVVCVWVIKFNPWWLNVICILVLLMGLENTSNFFNTNNRYSGTMNMWTINREHQSRSKRLFLYAFDMLVFSVLMPISSMFVAFKCHTESCGW